MAVLEKGNDFTTGDQVTAANLDALVDAATFTSGAVDNVTTQLSSGAIIVRDGGITTAKLADSNVTTAKIADSNVTTAKIADSNVTKAKIENLSDYTLLGNVSGAAAAPSEVSVLDEDDMASDSATAVPTQQSVKAYTDSVGGFTPSSYTGQESITFPNGLIMKMGRLATTSENTTVTFETAFPTALVSVVFAGEDTNNGKLSDTGNLGTTRSVSAFNIRHSGSIDYYSWVAYGY